MGFIDKFLQGLGFEAENSEKKAKPQKEKPQKKQITKNEYILNPSEKIENDIIEFLPQSQEDIFKIIDLLKTKHKIRIDFSLFDEESLIRALDFIQGACYVLDIAPVFESEKRFLLKP